MLRSRLSSCCQRWYRLAFGNSLVQFVRQEARERVLAAIQCSQVGWNRARRLWGGVSLSTCLLLALAGCLSVGPQAAATSTPTGAAPQLPFPPLLTFAPQARYADALRAITDLGLQPILPCDGRVGVPNGWVGWGPVGERALFEQADELWVQPSPLAPADWEARALAIPDVRMVSDTAVEFCPRIPVGTPPPGVKVFLAPGQAGTYLRVTFAHPLDTYDAALQAISDLGLRLADTCAERRMRATVMASPTTAPWRAVGQESGFDQTHALELATTIDSSNAWEEQVRSVAGVAMVQAPYVPTCA